MKRITEKILRIEERGDQVELRKEIHQLQGDERCVQLERHHGCQSAAPESMRLMRRNLFLV